MVCKSRLVAVLLLAFLGLLVFASADPTGPSTIVVEENTTSASSTSGHLLNISGGYVAKVNVTTTVQNTKWKAFVGDVAGAFTLDDASGSTIYNWSSGSSSGEVYATRTSGAVDWLNPIACATGPQIAAEDAALGLSGGDSIANTFSKTNDNDFIIAGTTLAATTCSSQNTFVNNASQDTDFEQIVAYDGANIVYATFVNSAGGYDGGTYDFQMLVPDNASSIAPIIPYYLFVELD
jgi:hypothetical protein